MGFPSSAPGLAVTTEPGPELSALRGARLGYKFAGETICFICERARSFANGGSLGAAKFWLLNASAFDRQAGHPFWKAVFRRSSGDGGVQPLQAIWQGRSISRSLRGADHFCPMHQLVKRSRSILWPGHPNVDLPEDFEIVWIRPYARRPSPSFRYAFKTFLLRHDRSLTWLRPWNPRSLLTSTAFRHRVPLV